MSSIGDKSYIFQIRPKHLLYSKIRWSIYINKSKKMLKVILLLALALCSVTALRMDQHQRSVQCFDSENNLIEETRCVGAFSCLAARGQLSRKPECERVILADW